MGLILAEVVSQMHFIAAKFSDSASGQLFPTKR